MAEVKVCSICALQKAAEEFYSSAPHSLWCKECTRAASRAYRNNHVDVVRERDRNRPNHRARAEATRDRSKSSRGKSLAALRRARWKEKNAHKIMANRVVGRAVKRGKIERAPCERCGAAVVAAHHEDYSKPLDVTWLCSICHGQRHREINKERRK